MRTFAVLAVLFPHVNTRNNHHVDHVFPQSLLTKSKLKQSGFDLHVIDQLLEMRDQLPNLQLLEGSENISKSDAEPAAWAEATYTTTQQMQAYLDRNQIPRLPTSTDDFESYFAERRTALAQRVRSTLASTAPAEEGTPTPESESPLRASIDDALETPPLGG